MALLLGGYVGWALWQLSLTASVAHQMLNAPLLVLEWCSLAAFVPLYYQSKLLLVFWLVMPPFDVGFRSSTA